MSALLIPSAEPTRIDVRMLTSSSRITVVVSGEIDAAIAPGLSGCLTDVLSRPGVDVVELDLRQVTFLDSAGLATLAGAHRSAAASGRMLGLRVAGARAVVRPLQITGLWRVLTVLDA